MRHNIRLFEKSILAKKIILPIASILSITTIGGAYYAGNFTSQTQEEARLMYIIAFIVSLSGIVMSYCAVRKILRPLYVSNQNLEQQIDERTSDLKDSYDKLREFSVAMQNISNSIIITSYDGVIEYVNKAFLKNTGYTEEEAIGENARLLQAYDSKSLVYKEITKTIRSGNIWAGELQNKRKNGETYWEKANISPIFLEDGSFQKFITVKADITKEVRLQENLKSSYKKLKELDKKKDEFISIASHELRTPMSVIKGYVSLMIDGATGDTTDKQKDFLQKIFDNSNQLIALVNDMLDLAKLESGGMKFQCEPINIYDFTKEIESEFQTMYRKKNMSINLSTSIDKNIKVKSDQNNLKRVYANLLSNAFKFSPESSEVNIIFEEYSRSNRFIQVRVQDFGIGIAKDKIGIIFEKFQQATNHLQRDFEGTGLGLAIVKDIIEKSGGNISVKSQEGKGTTFIFTLPKSKE
ncbi:PAS domain S-box protein [Candidatus Peregrinibacteria bacterium]|jgi:PAS domain S-box-containing protein|nr:PAS domain S-box protein [Candidatus Peregrinibacteria bacterium]